MKPIKLSNQAKYFWIAIVIIGTIGIWLPIIFELAGGEPVTWFNLPLTFTTYYIAIYFSGCVDSMLKLFDEVVEEPKSKLLNFIFMILVSIALLIFTIWLNLNDKFILPLMLSLMGTVIALKLWWENNEENPTFGEIIRSGSRSIQNSFPEE